MALDNTQIAISLAKAVIEKVTLEDNPEEAAKQAVEIYQTIYNSLPQKPPKRMTL
jgi:hypothetical protein